MKVKSVQGKIFPISPFDFSKSINFMNMFAPTNGEQRFIILFALNILWHDLIFLYLLLSFFH